MSADTVVYGCFVVTVVASAIACWLAWINR
jgi:hypothetical protein